MPLTVNLRHLEAHSLHLKGQVPPSELDIDTRDEVIQVAEPLYYDLEVEKMDDALLAQGKLRLKLNCQCVRCLKNFQHQLAIEAWACHIPLEGEERAPVINDCLDLT